jgi:hypothetical protein
MIAMAAIGYATNYYARYLGFSESSWEPPISNPDKMSNF